MTTISNKIVSWVFDSQKIVELHDLSPLKSKLEMAITLLKNQKESEMFSIFSTIDQDPVGRCFEVRQKISQHHNFHITRNLIHAIEQIIKSIFDLGGYYFIYKDGDNFKKIRKPNLYLSLDEITCLDFLETSDNQSESYPVFGREIHPLLKKLSLRDSTTITLLFYEKVQILAYRIERDNVRVCRPVKNGLNTALQIKQSLSKEGYLAIISVTIEKLKSCVSVILALKKEKLCDDIINRTKFKRNKIVKQILLVEYRMLDTEHGRKELKKDMSSIIFKILLKNFKFDKDEVKSSLDEVISRIDFSSYYINNFSGDLNEETVEDFKLKNIVADLIKSIEKILISYFKTQIYKIADRFKNIDELRGKESPDRARIDEIEKWAKNCVVYKADFGWTTAKYEREPLEWEFDGGLDDEVSYRQRSYLYPWSLRLEGDQSSIKTLKAQMIFFSRIGGRSIDEEQWTISLVAVGSSTGKHMPLVGDDGHAMIYMEGIENGTYFRKYADLRKESQNGTNVFIETHNNDEQVQKIRYSRTWRRAKKHVKKVIEEIEKDTKKEISFSLPSSLPFIGKRMQSHNCIKWAIEKIKSAKINLPSFEEIFQQKSDASLPCKYIETLNASYKDFSRKSGNKDQLITVSVRSSVPEMKELKYRDEWKKGKNIVFLIDSDRSKLTIESNKNSTRDINSD